MFSTSFFQLSRTWTARGVAAAALLLGASCGGSPTSPPPPPPTLAVSCPGAVDSMSIGGQPVPISYSAPATAGGSGPVTVTCAPAAGTSFPGGTTVVTCTAADSAGQQAVCSFPVTVRAVPRLLQSRFLTFGDSLTEGKLSLTVWLLVDSPAHSYPAKLQGLLDERYAGQNVSVINEGFGGERVTESAPRFRAALATHRPGAVLLMHGVNDLNGLSVARVQVAADALEELTKEARRAGIATFLATLPPLGPGPKASCPECVEPFNALLRGVAAAKGAILVDVHAAWGTGTGLMGADGIHPTEAGYAVIANAFFEAIRRTMEAPEGIQ